MAIDKSPSYVLKESSLSQFGYSPVWFKSLSLIPFDIKSNNKKFTFRNITFLLKPIESLTHQKNNQTNLNPVRKLKAEVRKNMHFKGTC